jgi:hypothetical protein
MKRNHLISSVLVAWALSACWNEPMTESTLPIEPAIVRSVPANAVPQTSILKAVANNRVLSICNFSAIYPDNRTTSENVTALHCLGTKNQVYKTISGESKDIVIAKSLSDKVKEINPKASFQLLTEKVPTTSQRSSISPENLGNRPLEIRGCLPDATREKMYCYKIKGQTVHATLGMPRWIHTMRLNLDDFEKITSRRHDFWDRIIPWMGNNTIWWISWSPVFDDKGNFFGVVSMQHLLKPEIQIQSIN